VTGHAIDGTAIANGLDAVGPGATVVDVGIGRGGNHLRGDVVTTAVADVANTIAAVPGGWNR